MAKVVGPIRPKYMVKAKINFDEFLNISVMPRVTPTVPKAENDSNNTSKNFIFPPSSITTVADTAKTSATPMTKRA